MDRTEGHDFVEKIRPIQVIRIAVTFALLTAPIALVDAREEEGVPMKAAELDPRLLARDEYAWNRLVPVRDGTILRAPGGTVSFSVEGDAYFICFATRDFRTKVKPSVNGTRVLVPGAGASETDLELLILAHPRFGSAFVVPARVLRFRSGGATVSLIDANGNGCFADRHEDAVLIERGREIRCLPQLENLPLGEDDLYSMSINANGCSVSIARSGAEGDAEHRRALVFLNALRVDAGLGECSLDQSLGDACAKHIAYLGRNGAGRNGHEEDPAKQGYSLEGARAGRNSCIARGCGAALDAIAGFHRMFYHRQPLFCPDSGSIGLRRSGSTVLLDMYSGPRRSSDGPTPFLYPFPDQYGVPREFDARESPDPTGSRGSAGYPISVRVGSSPVSDVVVELRTASGRGVPAAVTWPGNPANAAIPDNYGEILILPTTALSAFSNFKIRVQYNQGGRIVLLDWGFHTGN